MAVTLLLHHYNTLTGRYSTARPAHRTVYRTMDLTCCAHCCDMLRSWLRSVQAAEQRLVDEEAEEERGEFRRIRELARHVRGTRTGNACTMTH